MEDITRQVIGMAMKVHRKMGMGFLESIYHSCMTVELSRAGFDFESKSKLAVYYENLLVGQFEADLVIGSKSKLLVELKAVQHLDKTREVQLVNYLCATGIDDGLLINFGALSLEYKRKYRLPKTSTSPPNLTSS